MEPNDDKERNNKVKIDVNSGITEKINEELFEDKKKKVFQKVELNDGMETQPAMTVELMKALNAIREFDKNVAHMCVCVLVWFWPDIENCASHQG